LIALCVVTGATPTQRYQRMATGSNLKITAILAEEIALQDRIAILEADIRKLVRRAKAFTRTHARL